MTHTRLRAAASGAALLFFLVFAGVAAAQERTGWPGHVRGAADAPVVVIEFSDFGCPYCARFATETYPELHREFVESGKVRWVYVPFVMGMFPNGDRAAMAAECAATEGEDAFWRMHDRIYETQGEWKNSRSPETHFASLAAGAGLDRSAFEACYAEQSMLARVLEHNHLSAQAGVRATPTFFVQGQRVEGALPAGVFRTLLTQVVANAESARR